MAIITLTTDYGTKDYHAASVKGSILRELPDAHIVDVTHEIRPFNLSEAAYVLRNAYKDFPKGTIHIIGIDSELTESKPHLAVEVDGHFFHRSRYGNLCTLISGPSPYRYYRTEYSPGYGQL